MGKRANQEPVIKVDIGMDKETELEFFIKQEREHEVRGNGRPVVQKFAPALTMAHQEIDIIVAENVALIIADESLVAADNNWIRTVATDNKSFRFHVVLKKHPYSCGYETPVFRWSANVWPSLLCKHAIRGADHTPAGLRPWHAQCRP